MDRTSQHRSSSPRKDSEQKPEETTRSSQQATPLVSVIIPTYNDAAFISETIACVQAQDYTSVEIIVIDDGSTDATPEILASFGATIRYFRQANRGPSAARNKGIQEATGEIIGFLDADDLYAPNFITQLIAFWNNQNHRDVRAVYCGCRFISEQGTPLPYLEDAVTPAEQLYDVLLQGNFLATHSLLVEKQCLQQLQGFDESLQLCEDWDLWLRMAKHHQVMGMPDALVMRRVRQESVSRHAQQMHDARMRVLTKHLQDSSSLNKHVAYGQAHLTAAVDELKQHNTGNASIHLLRAFQIAPELLSKLSTFWQLLIGSQATGYRGDLKTLNIDENAAILLRILKNLSSAEPAPPVLMENAEKIRETFQSALGLLYYSNGELDKACSCFFAGLSESEAAQRSTAPASLSYWDIRLQNQINDIKDRYREP